jgi:predicted NACHT family NTPase
LKTLIIFFVFKSDTFAEQISKFLEIKIRFKYQSDEIIETAEGVFKAIEAQHGLLVERADGIWSFSHLTFQEYFTTKWLLELPRDLLSQKIFNKGWQEVVNRIVKAQGQSDDLLRMIKKSIDYSVDRDVKIQDFLNWIFEKSESVDEKSENEIRQFYFSISHIFDLYIHGKLDLDFRLLSARALNFDTTGELNKHLRNDLTSSRRLDLDLLEAFILMLELDYDLDLASDIDTLLSRSFLNALNLDNKFLDVLKELKGLFRKFSGTENFDVWWEENGRDWREHVIKIITRYRNIGHSLSLTDNQQRKLQHYSDANKFLVELLTIKNAVSPEVRQEIEDNLLLPIAELKRRLPDQYGGIEES